MGIRIRIRIRILTVSSFLHLSARPPTVSATMSIQVKPQASTETPLISLGKGAEIDDVWSTDDVDSEHPMSCGIFTQKKDDEVFSYTYGYHEVKVTSAGGLLALQRVHRATNRAWKLTTKRLVLPLLCSPRLPAHCLPACPTPHRLSSKASSS